MSSGRKILRKRNGEDIQSLVEARLEEARRKLRVPENQFENLSLRKTGEAGRLKLSQLASRLRRRWL